MVAGGRGHVVAQAEAAAGTVHSPGAAQVRDSEVDGGGVPASERPWQHVREVRLINMNSSIANIAIDMIPEQIPTY